MPLEKGFKRNCLREDFSVSIFPLFAKAAGGTRERGPEGGGAVADGVVGAGERRVRRGGGASGVGSGGEKEKDAEEVDP